MTTFSRDDLRKTAQLAALALSDEDIEHFTPELNNIMTMIQQIQDVNTENIEPMAHPLDLSQRLRPDEVSETDQHTLFQTLAPECQADHYLVPPVIED